MKRGIMMALLALGCTAALGIGSAEEDKKKPAEDPFVAMTKAAQPGPEHKHLAAMAGTFDAAIKYWMEPGKPPGEAKGTITRKMVLGGRFLQEEVKGTFAGAPFTGFGLTGYDKQQKKYVSVWADTMATSLSNATGEADKEGKVFTFHREDIDPASGKKSRGRDVIKVEGKDKQVMEMYRQVGPDGKETKVMEIVFTRKK